MLRILKNKIRMFDYFLIFIFCFFPLMFTLFNNFIGDDFCWLYQAREAVRNNNIFITLAERSPYDYFRPLSSFLFTMFFYFADSVVIYYRILSILLHFSNSILIYLLVLRLGYERRIALFTGLLFSVIAVHSETILNISSFNILLSSLFISLIIIYYTGIKYKRNYYLISLFVFLLMFLRESNLTIVFLLLIISIWQKKNDYRKVILFSLLPVLLYFIIRHFCKLDLNEYIIQERSNAFWEHMNIFKIFYTIPHYIINTVLPVKLILSFLSDELYILLKKSFSNPGDNKFIFSILFSGSLAVAILLFYIIYKKLKNEYIFPFLIFLASIVLYIPLYQTSERFVYYASAGICIIMVVLFSKIKFGNLAVILFTVIHLLGLFYGMNRWKDASEYYQDMPFEIHSLVKPYEESKKILISNLITNYKGTEIISEENINRTMDFYFPELNKIFLLSQDTSSDSVRFDIELIYNSTEGRFYIENQ